MPEAWWQLYHDAADEDVLVPVRDLPESARPGALAHFDLESMKVTDVYDFADGSLVAADVRAPHRPRHRARRRLRRRARAPRIRPKEVQV
ncbi:MAG: hypothetical protein R2726_03085 [Acidimicrobiales bacterium]